VPARGRTVQPATRPDNARTATVDPDAAAPQDAGMNVDPVTTKLLSTTDSSEWEHVDSLSLNIVTDHPQGLLRMGQRYFLSTVRFTKSADGHVDPSTPGQGFLIELERDGSVVHEKARLALSRGLVFHPGGLATDGHVIYAPVSEYRPDSSCHVYRVDAESFEILGDPIHFPDHIGALSMDAARRRIFGMSWASKKIYVWDDQWTLLYMNLNPVQNVDYQDIDFVGGNTLACGGVSAFDVGGQRVEVAGIDLIDATTWLPYHRIMVTTRTHTGRLLTHNAFTHTLLYPNLIMAFVPDDDADSRVEVYRI
jgi:hypothetical protein